MDVFEPIAALLPLQDIGTLDELATELFAVQGIGNKQASGPVPPGRTVCASCFGGC